MYYLDKSVIFPCLSCCLGQEITGCFFHLLVGGVGAKKQGFRVRLAPGQDPVLGHISVQCWFVMGLLASLTGTLQAHVGSLWAPFTPHSLFCFSSECELSQLLWKIYLALSGVPHTL